MGETIKEASSANNGLNFTEEAENLGDSGNWFTPDTGSTKITFNNNGIEDTREYDGDTREVVVFDVIVDGDNLKWTVNRARAESSLFGQIVKVGAAKGGLVGETITLIRSGTGTDTQYTVVEASDL